MATQEKMLTAIFRDHAAAADAFDWLQVHLGYTTDEINVLMSDKTRATFTADRPREKITASSMASEGMAAGGAIGTAVGAALGAIAAIGTTIALPGLGLVIAGPIVAGLAGGGAGAVAGGIVGGLVGLGIPESNVKAYQDALRAGGVAVGVTPHSSDDASEIREYFEEHGAENIVNA